MHLSKKAIIIGSLALLAVASIVTTTSFTQYTCLQCRATLFKRQILSIPFEYISKNQYSDLFQKDNPSHHHKWCWWGSVHSGSLISYSMACGRQHPIWRLPISVQAEYSHLVSPTALTRSLEIIDSKDQKAADAEVDRVYEQVLDSQQAQQDAAANP